MALPHEVKRKELSLAIKPIITGHGVFSWKIFLTIMKPETYVALPLKTSVGYSQVRTRKDRRRA